MESVKDKDALFVAGLISTKNPVLEDHDEIKKRYEEAKAVVGEQIALSPAVWICICRRRKLY